ncbi:MAG TPA: DNA polymerase III subunit beta [Candidatus Taylorbacteria bacterium]|nr:MAG: polymerase III subunit beta protein [Parcubacteria group bacterium GW2011_GWA2_47_64]KKU96817.1 MAG: polymerase III subunit beta protein [Parcubacteria group bacterium GW2011_GWC2_48_17]HBV01353.1 DNA polymerase III subunit beta [Candidatus Taylorbacteria bacterium]
MKIEVIKDKLQIVVGKAQRLSSKHLSLPILSHVLLTAKHGSLVVRATNLDMGGEYTIPAKVDKEGSVAVPAVVFSSFISNLGGARSVILDASDNKLTISTEGNKAIINGASSDDFPTIPKAEGSFFSIDPQMLLKGFKSVYYAGALGNLKPELSSVFLYHDNEEFVFAATDSFRLAEKRIQFKKTATAFQPVLVPIKNVAEIIRMLEEEKDEIRVFVAKGQLSIEGNNLLFTSRLIEGSFPDYKQIIPKDSVAEAVVLKEDLLGALKLTALFSDRFNQLHIHLDQKKKLFELSARSGELGESKSSVHAALSGETVQSNFNYRYIADCLPAISADSMAFRWSGDNRPLLIGGVGDKSFRYMVMPMNR